MTRNQKMEIVERINAYADRVLSDINPQNTPLSVQLEALRPEMEKIAEETKQSLSRHFYSLYGFKFLSVPLNRSRCFRRKWRMWKQIPVCWIRNFR